MLRRGKCCLSCRKRIVWVWRRRWGRLQLFTTSLIIIIVIIIIIIFIVIIIIIVITTLFESDGNAYATSNSSLVYHHCHHHQCHHRHHNDHDHDDHHCHNRDHLPSIISLFRLSRIDQTIGQSDTFDCYKRTSTSSPHWLNFIHLQRMWIPGAKKIS